MTRVVNSFAALALIGPALLGLTRQADVNVEIFLLNPASGTLEGTTGKVVAAQFGVEASRPGVPVVVTLDLSGLVSTQTTHSSPGPCQSVAPQTVRCEFVSETYSQAVTVGFSSETLGPVGVLRARVAPRDDTDTNPNDNTSSVNVEFISGKPTTFIVAMPTVGEGAIGDTITMPATVTNRGSNALGWTQLKPNNLYGARYLGGGAGCAATTCMVKNVLPGQSKTVQLRYIIDSCPAIVQPLAVIVTYDSTNSFDWGASRVQFNLRVAGCANNSGGGSSGGGSSNGGQGQPGSVPGASLTPFPTPTGAEPQTPSPTAGQATSPESAPSVALPPAASSSRGPLFAGIGLAMLLALATAAIFIRRRALAISSAAQPESPATPSE